MPGWDTAAACLASDLNRASVSGCSAYSARSRLTATRRPSTRSWASHTSPTPPAAIRLSSRYRPASTALFSDTTDRLYPCSQHETLVNGRAEVGRAQRRLEHLAVGV